MIAATPNESICLQNCFDTGSRAYWVRQMRQLPWAPFLKIPHIVSFCCICFFRDHYDFGRKIAKYKIKSKDFFF